jgi:hypothetical protein
MTEIDTQNIGSENDVPSTTEQVNDDEDVNELGAQLDAALNIQDVPPPNILVCDAGYGFPREKRPFQEKLNAISSQLVNFLTWQMGDEKINTTHNLPFATVQVVGCPDETVRSALEAKLLEKLDAFVLPSHVTISCLSLEECIVALQAPASEEADTLQPVYLSPDAEESLDPCNSPPTIAIVGLLIDRRIQPNRSKDRASKLSIVSKRWPLEECFADIHAKEPLNVDCVLEGMQQWWWNCAKSNGEGSKELFVQAASQAINHHAKRHPCRPLHIASP